jgi:hypothetical protein
MEVVNVLFSWSSVQMSQFYGVYFEVMNDHGIEKKEANDK